MDREQKIRVRGGSRVSGRFSAGAQGQGASHPVHLSGRRKLRPEFKSSDGYWMQLSQWNRFRHDTFKERPEDEIMMPFILGTGPSSVLAAELDSGGPKAKSVQSSHIKQVFTLASEGVHVQKDKKEIPCFHWTCTQKDCKLKGKLIKEMRKGTGMLFRHLQSCNEALWRKLRLSSKHSKALLDEEGEEIEVSLETSTCIIVPVRGDRGGGWRGGRRERIV